MHQCIKFIYFGIALCMFRTVFLSIIRSTRLYIQQQAYVRYCCLLAGRYPLASRQQHLPVYMPVAVCSLVLLMMDGKTIRNM